MRPVTLLIIMRLTAALVLAVGAVMLAYEEKSGWGWLLVGSIVFGCIAYDDNNGVQE